ncbi:MAG: trans-2-enoyl-CoA reductase family protein [Pseudomonadaceae bacterium]|nr:trans-2-enoyl-CoA reductase family protein [Pseudomonadaceae bacterium]
MIIKPKIRGFICTTSHPTGCAYGVDEQIALMRERGPIEGSKRALVLGCSGGYGLSSRIAAAFGCGAATVGVSFEKPPTERKPGTAGWYNNTAFDKAANDAGLYSKTFDGDAFSDEMKQQVVDTIKADLGDIDLLIYSLASPVRAHPKTGVLHRSAIKPLGETVRMKGVNVDKGDVTTVELEPADEEETANTVAVMGGEDWEFWVDALKEAGVLAEGFQTYAYTYIGSDLTWPLYWEGTLGQAKRDLDRARDEIADQICGIGGDARVAVLKGVVTQASSAIPILPLYIALLFQVMKERGEHEDCAAHIQRLFATQLYGNDGLRLDDDGRVRMDDLELADDVQEEVRRRWAEVTTESLPELGDLAGYNEDFLKIFGFGHAGVDYEAEVDPLSVG